jgi:hypothetical protein
LDHEGSPVSLADAIDKVETAITELGEKGFAIDKLKENLGLLKSIKV